MLNKTILVTGGSGEIGRAIAIEFGKAGYNVAIGYNSNLAEAEKTLALVNETGANAVIIKADLRNFSEAKLLVEKTKEAFGHIHVLVNNAGISHIGLFNDLSIEEWDNVMAANLNSAFYCTRLVLDEMISRKDGVIINISSMWGQVGASCEVAYSVSKAGMIGLTKALAKEVAPSNVRVNAIAPGVIDTKMNAGFDDLEEDIPLGRMGKGSDIAKACLFLAEEGGNFICGQVLGINGGEVI